MALENQPINARTLDTLDRGEYLDCKYKKRSSSKSLLTDSPLAFIKVWGLANITGTFPINPGTQNYNDCK
jgi:hypothetical protein